MSLQNNFPNFSKVFIVTVKPNSKCTKYEGIDKRGRHKILIKEKAEDNKANIALIKFFRKEFKLNVKIKSGLTSREKTIEIL